MIILRQNNFSSTPVKNLKDYVDYKTLKGKSDRDKIEALDKQYEIGEKNSSRSKEAMGKLSRTDLLKRKGRIYGATTAGLAAGYLLGHKLGRKGSIQDKVVPTALMGALGYCVSRGSKKSGEEDDEMEKGKLDFEKQHNSVRKSIELGRDLDKQSGSGDNKYENIALNRAAERGARSLVDLDDEFAIEDLKREKKLLMKEYKKKHLKKSQNNFSSRFSPKNLENYTDPISLKNKSHKDKLKAIDEELDRSKRNEELFNNYVNKKKHKLLPVAAGIGTVAVGAKVGGVTGGILSLPPALAAGVYTSHALNKKYHKSKENSKSNPSYRTIELARSLDKQSGGHKYEDYALSKLISKDPSAKTLEEGVDGKNHHYSPEDLEFLRQQKKEKAKDSWRHYKHL